MKSLRPLLALALAAAALAPSPSSGKADEGTWVRVSFSGRITPEARVALETTGLDAIQYEPENAYVGFGDAAVARAAAAVRGVAGVRELTASEKVDPRLRGTAVPALVQAVVYAPRLADVAGSLGVPSLRSVSAADPDFGSLIFPAVALDVLASHPAVLTVGEAPTGIYPDEEGTSQILAGNISAGKPVAGYEAWLAQKGLDGEGVLITIADTGMDETHPELAGRILETQYSEAGDPGGHGTHVSGIIGGKGAMLAGPVRAMDHEGMLLGLGLAPKVRFQDLALIGGNAPGFPPSDFHSFTREASQAGAIGWNASWNTGGPANGGYVPLAKNLDLLVRDADATTAGDQPYTMVFSSGNSGSGARTITQPKEAKNIITLGSTMSQRVVGTAVSIDTMSAFSSRGPARDGRILPTVVAPGEEVISSKALTSTGSCTQPTSAAGVYGMAAGAAHYIGCSGTSMAAPHGTGAVVLIHDWWRTRNGGADPSPAMDKALLVNTATDMGNADVPNGNEGWGRINLGALFDATAQRIYVDQSVLFDELIDVEALDVVPADPSKPLKVTLVWTDAPGKGSAAAKALVNDLDLTLTAPGGSVYRGNVFSAGKSQSGGVADRLNNVENVFLAQAPDGTYRIEVRPFNLPGNGVPASPSLTDQDFALVISNARPAPQA